MNIIPKQLKQTGLAALLLAASAWGAKAQSDSIYLHNGQVVGGKVYKIAEQTVTFTYADEDAQQTLGKYAVQKVIFGKSKRVQDVSERITVRSKDDWEKVVILEDVANSVGLKKQGEIRGKTAGMLSYRTAGNADKKSMERLKKEAAELGAPFVLLTSEKDSRWSTQSIKKGFAYSYK